MKTKTRVVLCVDDDPDDRELICTAIKDLKPEFEVIHAENGLQATNILKKFKKNGEEFPCLIILDINMPIMNGKEALIEIKKDTTFSKIPVAMFSTSSNTADKNFCNLYGVELVTKPNKFESIFAEVQRLLTHCSDN